MPFATLSLHQLPLFPHYLTPSITRRKSSSASASSTSSNATSDSTSASAPTAQTYLADSPPHIDPPSRLRCARCLSDLALSSQIISKGFNGRFGRAYLVSPVPSNGLCAPTGDGEEEARAAELPNTFSQRPAPRQLVTGLHTVADIGCIMCGAGLGWKYLAAEEEGQRYKVGKFILEEKRVVAWGGWEDDAGGPVCSRTPGLHGEGEVEFDSQDEDECEDLFSGRWTRERAMKRRRGKGVPMRGGD